MSAAATSENTDPQKRQNYCSVELEVFIFNSSQKLLYADILCGHIVKPNYNYA